MSFVLVTVYNVKSVKRMKIKSNCSYSSYSTEKKLSKKSSLLGLHSMLKLTSSVTLCHSNCCFTGIVLLGQSDHHACAWYPLIRIIMLD